MKRQFNLVTAVVLTAILVCSASALAHGVQVRFNIQNPQATPFPSDLFSIEDSDQNTGLRVDLPFPDCAKQVSDCELIELTNTLDGFNLQPRLSIPFTGSIDVETVTSEMVFLIHLGSTLAHSDDDTGKVIGINQIVWDPKANTLHVESDAFLAQHTRYALIVTRGVRDSDGAPISSKAFEQFRRKLASEPELRSYRKALDLALRAAREVGIRNKDVVAASVFTTQSITSFLEKARDQIRAATPELADFQLGFDGSRTVFPVADITRIVGKKTFDTAGDVFFSDEDLKELAITPDVVSMIAFGRYRSPDYRTTKSGTSDPFIPPIGTRSDIPQTFGTNEVFFNLFIPAGQQPSAGWPVTIFGHGAGSSKNVVPFFIAATLAKHGIATIGYTAVGHGGGQDGTLTIHRANTDRVTLSAGGRSVDLNNDGFLEQNEGFFFNDFESFEATVLFGRDGRRQTIVDLMQLVRVIEMGVDVDSDRLPDLDASRISYVGQSRGGNHGALLLAVEPAVASGVLNVLSGDTVDFVRLNPPPGRGILAISLATLKPPLTNVGNPSDCIVKGFGSDDCDLLQDLEFDEKLPLRNQPPVINDVPGAMAIQAFLDGAEWIDQVGSPVAYATHLREKPLAGMPPKSVIVQFAKGDHNVPNPSTTAFLRAGELADRATFYRHDFVFNDPTVGELPENPHNFLLDLDFPNPLVALIALAAQEQIAEFFASEGAVVIDPDDTESLAEVPILLFETPINPPLPEDCGFVVEIPDFKVCQ